MSKVHAPHPTQHAACGAPSFVTVLVESAFGASTNKCKRCAKVLAARDAGRPHFSGLEPAALGVQPNQTFDVLISGDRTTLSVADIDAVAAYFRPGRPDIQLLKRAAGLWQIRSEGRVIGSVHEVSVF